MAVQEDAVSAGDYLDITKVREVSVSPTGSHVAFVRRTPRDEETYDTSIQVASLEENTVEQYTLTDAEYSEPSWNPSGEYLAFVSTRGDSGRSQLWVLPAGGGEARQVTDVVGDVSSIAWAPDGARIAFVQRVTQQEREAGLDTGVPEGYEREVPDLNVIDRTVYRGRGEGWIYNQRKHVYVVSVDDGTVTSITEGDFDHKQPDWGDERTLYFTAKRTGDPDDNQIHDVIRFNLDAGTEDVLAQTSSRSPTPKATRDGKVAFVYVPNTESDEYLDDDPGPKWYKKGLQVYHPDGETLTTPTKDLNRTVYSKATGSPFTWASTRRICTSSRPTRVLFGPTACTRGRRTRTRSRRSSAAVTSTSASSTSVGTSFRSSRAGGTISTISTSRTSTGMTSPG